MEKLSFERSQNIPFNQRIHKNYLGKVQYSTKNSYGVQPSKSPELHKRRQPAVE